MNRICAISATLVWMAACAPDGSFDIASQPGDSSAVDLCQSNGLAEAKRWAAVITDLSAAYEATADSVVTWHSDSAGDDWSDRAAESFVAVCYFTGRDFAAPAGPQPTAEPPRPPYDTIIVVVAADGTARQYGTYSSRFEPAQLRAQPPATWQRADTAAPSS